MSCALACLPQALEKQLQGVDLELDENAGRVTVMDEHLKNVRQEITYAQHRVSSAGLGDRTQWQRRHTLHAAWQATTCVPTDHMRACQQ